MKRYGIALLLCLAGGAVSARAQESWLPAPVENAIAEQTIARLEAISPTPVKDRTTYHQSVRKLVHSLRAQLESWGEDSVLDRSPLFPRLNFPTANQKHLNAMARYQACNWVLIHQQGKTYDLKTRRNGALATAAVSLTVVFLRKPFTAQGGKNQEIESFLTGPPMDHIFKQVMKNTDLLSHVEEQCQPVVSALFEFSANETPR